MSKRSCVVLVQDRKTSEYNDFIGKYYHFPKKYFNLLSSGNHEFVYFEPIKKGSGSYFGYGKLGKVFPDKREKDYFFAEIEDYKLLTEEVPFKDPDGKPRETGKNYNAQNAARIISPSELDAICLDGGIQLSFTSDAHLVKVLGEELIATEVVGILELVKNAYDANASKCTVRVEQIPNLTQSDKEDNLYNDYIGPVIVVEDNGNGMTRSEIEFG